MNLKILIPNKIVLEESVNRIVAEGFSGAFGILPRHIDFVESLVPGILVLETESGDEQYVAVDEGILVKQGESVWVSVMNAVRGEKLGDLRETIAQEFEELDERDKKSRSALAKLEADFIRRFVEQPI